MSLLETIKKIFRIAKKEDKASLKLDHEFATFGLKIGSKVEISHPAIKYGSSQYTLEKWNLPFKEISAESISKTCNGVETECIFYTSDEENFIQVFYEGAEDAKNNRIRAILWMYCDFTEVIGSQETADRWIDTMNQSSFELDGKTYSRVSETTLESSVKIKTIHGDAFHMDKQVAVFERELSSGDIELLTVGIEIVPQDNGDVVETGVVAVGVHIDENSITVY